MNDKNQKAMDKAIQILYGMRTNIQRITIKKGEIEVNLTITSSHYIDIGKAIKELINAVQDQSEQTEKYFELYTKEVAKEVIE